MVYSFGGRYLASSRLLLSICRQRAITASLIFSLGCSMACGAMPAGSRTEYEPIDITVGQTDLVPGKTLPVQVDLNHAGSANVTVYSDPPGAVFYQGTLQSGDTVPAATNVWLPSSTAVTIYAVTTGQTVVQTQVPVQ